MMLGLRERERVSIDMGEQAHVGNAHKELFGADLE